MEEKQKVTMKEIVEEKNPQIRNEKYNQYVEQATPKHNCLINTANAFWMGGLICVVGQIFQNIYGMLGASKEDAGLYTTISLVLCSVILTGLNWYPKMAKLGGAGTIVPITGFANSIAASAMDYKVQGQVFGIGCFIFSIAGPVILYGIFSSWLLGLIYWGISMWG